MLRLLAPGSGPVALAWLVHSISTRLAQPGVPDWDFIEEAWQPLSGALEAVPPATVAPMRQGLETIIRYAESIPDPDPADAESGDRRLYFVDLRQKLTALVAASA